MQAVLAQRTIANALEYPPARELVHSRTHFCHARPNSPAAGMTELGEVRSGADPVLAAGGSSGFGSVRAGVQHCVVVGGRVNATPEALARSLVLVAVVPTIAALGV